MRRPSVITGIASIFMANVVGAALYTDAGQLPTDIFDFVIVGGT